MHVGSLHRPETLASVGSVTSLELIMAAVIVVLALSLWATRSKRARDQRRRKAAATGYYDSDAARFGPGTASTPSGSAPVPVNPSLAPTFAAPLRSKAGRSARRGQPAPMPAMDRPPMPVPSFATFDPSDTPSRPLPPFDPAVPAIGGPVRVGTPPPAPSVAPLPPPPPPPAAAGDRRSGLDLER